jgi:alanine dehydrogenase
VANIPGSVARTSTLALSNVTVPYGLQIANKGFKRAALENRAIAKGLNTVNGELTCKAVAEAHGLSYKDVNEVLENKAVLS